MLVVEQEGIMPGAASDLGINHAQAIVQQGKDDFARTRRRESPVGRKAGDEETRPRTRQRGRQVAVVLVGGIEVVERLGRHQIRVPVNVGS